VSERGLRTIAGIIGVASALIVLTGWEQHQAVSTPDGWTMEGQPARPALGVPRIIHSRWRLAPGNLWRAQAPVDHWYFRVRLPEGGRLQIMPAGPSDGMVMTFEREAVPTLSSAIPQNDAPACEGALPAPSEADYSLEVSATQGGVLLASGDQRMACSSALSAPALRAVGAGVELSSLGTGGRPVGVPLSPLDWLGGVALLGFLWMVLVEVELWRGLPWHWIVVTGAPCVVGGLLLFVTPTATVSALGGASVPQAILLAVGVVKLIAIGVGRPQLPAGEE